MNDLETALRSVTDPEIPVRLHDLGVIRSAKLAGSTAFITLSPTRLGCPALAEIAARVRTAALTVSSVAEVELIWEPRAWQPSDISPAGRQALHEAGYGTAEQGLLCPHCGSADVVPVAEYGSSICRRPLHCRRCGTPFDVLRPGPCRADP